MFLAGVGIFVAGGPKDRAGLKLHFLATFIRNRAVASAMGHGLSRRGCRSEIALEPIREVWIHDEVFAASRLNMMRIMARRMKAATVVA